MTKCSLNRHNSVQQWQPPSLRWGTQCTQLWCQSHHPVWSKQGEEIRLKKRSFFQGEFQHEVDLSMWTGSLFSQNAVVNAWHSYDRQHNIQLENPNLCCTCITVLPVTTVSRSDNSLLWDEGPGAHQRPIAPTSDQDQVRKFTWKSAAAKILWNYKLWENTLKKLSKIFWEILNQVQHLFPHRFCPLAEKKEDPRQLAQQSQQKWEENTCFRSSWDVSYPL